jgi:ribonuclease T2
MRVSTGITLFSRTGAVILTVQMFFAHSQFAFSMRVVRLMRMIQRICILLASQWIAIALLTLNPLCSVAQAKGQPGVFDFYLLTLSWSPQFCSTHQTNPECTPGGTAFVVHGLWPEYSNGRWPANCSRARGPSNPSLYADLIPATIIQHEWSKHGTCSGLSVSDYFALIRKVRSSIAIPQTLQTLSQQIQESSADVKAAFATANPILSMQDIAVGCTQDGFLDDVEICMSKAGQPIPCPVIPDCPSSQIKILPVGR